MTKYVKFRIVGTVVVVAVLGFATVAVGGDLDPPPGPIGPTMKTLDDIEPRTILYPEEGSKGESRAAVLTISTPGSYVLGGPITGPAGWNGIEISASNVTLDLGGFPLQGVYGTGDAIVVTAAFNNIAIFNGTIAGWGVDASQAANCRIWDLRVSDTDGCGIKVGSGMIAHCCVGAGFNTQGIHAGTHTIISDCVVAGVLAPGISAGSYCTVRNCNVSYVTDVAATGTASIEVDSRCYVIGNSVAEFIVASRADGILATGVGNHIEGNVITASAGTSYRAIVVTGTGNVIVKNSLYNYTTPHNIAAGNAYGTFINVAGGGAFVTNEPWANLIY